MNQIGQLPEWIDFEMEQSDIDINPLVGALQERRKKKPDPSTYSGALGDLNMEGGEALTVPSTLKPSGLNMASGTMKPKGGGQSL